MRKIAFAFLLTAAYALWSSMAMAEGMYEGAPCCEGWQGFYFGAYFGAGQGNADTTFTDTQTTEQIIIVPGQTTTIVSIEQGWGSLTGDITGSTVDLFVGYNFQAGSRFVVGGQFEGTVFSDLTLKTIGRRNSTSNTTQTTVTGGVTTVVTAADTQSGTSELTDELRSMPAFVGRAGVLVTPNVLLYRVGGVVVGNFVVPDGDDPFGGDREQWEVGYTVGGGGEVRLNPAWSLRGEYRFYRFDYDRKQSTSQTTVQGNTTFTFENTFERTNNTEVDLHMGKIGVVYRFCNLFGRC